MYLRLGSRLSVGPYMLWSRVKYEQNSLFLHTDLAHVLNYNSTGEGVNAQYVWTPFTTFGVQMERQRDRFTSTGDRNSDNLTVRSSNSTVGAGERAGNCRVPNAQFCDSRRARLYWNCRTGESELHVSDPNSFYDRRQPPIAILLLRGATGLRGRGSYRRGDATPRRLVGRRWIAGPRSPELS